MARDGRTARAQLIKERVHEEILRGYIDLLRAGTPFPTESDRRAGGTIAARHLQAFCRSQPASGGGNRPDRSGIALVLSAANWRRSISASASAAVHRATGQMLEEVVPFRRVALAAEHVDPLVASVMKRVRANAVKEIERAVHPALDGLSASEKRNVLLALHMICAWPSWETLRSHHGLRPSAARALITRAALATLNSALREVGRT